jgi:predicted GIY-YIG superfamily endonuclease
VPSRQLQLFAPPRPLEQRLGKEFFAAVPACSGVYIMTGQSERVLYIGQSINLRARLATYKNARPDRAPRKVIRLVHEVTSIVWECCHSPQEAIARESELLQLHRPRFNRVGTWPAKPLFLYVVVDESGCELGRTSEPAGRLRLFGPFKGVVPAHAALVRFLWVTAGGLSSCVEFPTGLLGWRVPPRQRLSWTPATAALERASVERLVRFLRGQPDELKLHITKTADACLAEILTLDLELLESFDAFARGARSTRGRSFLSG